MSFPTATLQACILAVVLRLIVAVLALVSSTGVQAQRAPAAPESATAVTGKRVVHGSRHMVAAANAYAVEAGRDILRRGGNAIDAVIAVQLVLNLVEPQSSGIGGGAFMVHFDAATKSLTTYDGRETAPSSAKADRFLKGGRPMPFGEAVRSGLSVGVPGVLAAMEMAHRQYGRLPWADLFAPTIKLATDGFIISPRLNLLLAEQGAAAFSPGARRYFFDASGAPWPAGHRLANPEFSGTLRAIAAYGAAAFYTGPIAADIVRAVGEAPGAKGDLTLADIAGYRAKERLAVCTAYRRRQVCGMGPPSSGGIAVGQTLALLEPFDLGRGSRGGMPAHALHIIAEAEKLAYADRDRYVADSDITPVPSGLLDPAYLDGRRPFMHALTAAPKATAGTPPGLQRVAYGADETHEASGTSHISIIDGAGNAVAMTTSIETAFGSRLWAAGFMLNNQLTDFSFRPRAPDGRPIANRVEPGKRPRSSMSPTIVLDERGVPEAVLGSPGGSRIILYVLKAIVGLVDWGLDAQAAAALDNFGSRGSTFELELSATSLADVLASPWAMRSPIWHALKIKPYGHIMTFDAQTSGVHIIVRRPDGMLEGGADPRREGIVLAD
ncbi:MAG: gamma-glutamyltransferase [Hyphomicrobiaceae bacterium]